MSLPDNEISTESTYNEPKVLFSGEGRTVAIGKGAQCTFKVVGKETRGHFGLFEYAEGEVELLVGDERITGTAGTVAVVPRGAVHAFSNPGDNRSVLLIMFCPADSREKYFEGLAELTKGGKKPDRQALLALMREHDQEPMEEEGWTF